MQGMATDTLEKTLEEQFLQFLLEQGKKVACKYSYTVGKLCPPNYHYMAL